MRPLDRQISDTFEPSEILPLYGSGIPEQVEFYDSSRGENDVRYTHILHYPGTEKIALKITKNAFTTPQRVNNWAALAEYYNGLGIYAPRFLKNARGAYFAEINGFLVYAEEYIDGKIAKNRAVADKGDIRDDNCGRAMLESLGLVAANPAPLVPWYSEWCLYDKFEGDECDENYECAAKFTDYIKENLPNYTSRAQFVFDSYNRLRADFEPIYRTLPKAVFQGDLNSSNVVLTDNGGFKGLFDFNLSGSEVILNYLFCECHSSLGDFCEDKIETLLDKKILEKHDRQIAKYLSYTCRHYKFSDDEKYAFNTYYNITFPFRWQNYSFLMHYLRKDGKRYAEEVLAWIEYQMDRKDVLELVLGN